jgi:hypothetical protein
MALMQDFAQPSSDTGSGPIDTTATALAFFVDKGYTPEQASGIVGNLLAESNLNTGAIGDGGISRGIAQWNRGRLANLQSFARASNADPNDLFTQLEFVHHELRGPEAAANRNLQRSTDPRSAALSFIGFERPEGWTAANPAGGHNASGRIANAEASLPLARELAQNTQDGALITSPGPQAGRQTAGSIGTGGGFFGGLASDVLQGGSGGDTFRSGMMAQPPAERADDGSPLLRALGMALMSGSRQNPFANLPAILQAQAKETQAKADRDYNRWRDERQFQTGRQDAAQSQENLNRAFGLQSQTAERSAANDAARLKLAQEQAAKGETRALPDGSTVRIEDDGTVKQLTPPIRQLNEVEKRKQDADGIGLTGDARTRYILTGQYDPNSGVSLNPYASPSGVKTTGEQDKSAGFADRMFQNESTIRTNEGLGTSRFERGANAIPGVGSMLTSDDFKKYEAAKQNWIAAQLRKESGAAIGAQEYEAADRQYFPQPGDPPDVIAQKRALRQTATEGMARDGGPGYRPRFVFDEKGNLTPYQPGQRQAPAPQAQPQPAPTPNPAVRAAPPQGAVEMLRQNPALREQFDAKYGPGASDRILSGR